MKALCAAIAVCASLLAASPALAYAIDSHHAEQEDDLIQEPLELRDGRFTVPSAPGLGVELNREFVTSMLGHDYRPVETYDADDGSVVDR